jgi:hypothetical protein
MSLIGKSVTAVYVGTDMSLTVTNFCVIECVETYFHALYVTVCRMLEESALRRIFRPKTEEVTED